MGKTAVAEQKWSASELKQRLKEKHPLPAWAYFDEVPNATGWSKSRTADGLAVGCWESVGMQIHGFEVKVLRSDWLKEAQHPEKAEAFKQFCHRWWIVAAPGIVKLEELPGDWGLMEPVGDGLKVRKAGVALSPKPMDIEFLAALLRVSATRMPSAAALKEEFDRGRECGLKCGESRVEAAVTIASVELNALKKDVADFEERSGLMVRGYRGDHMADAVKALATLTAPGRTGWQQDPVDKAIREMRAAIGNCETLVNAAETVLKRLQSTFSASPDGERNSQ